LAKWRDIENHLEPLTALRPDSSWRERYSHFRRRAGHVRDIRLLLAQFKSADLWNQRWLSEHHRAVYDTDRQRFIPTHLDRAVQDRFTFPTQPTEELVEFIDRRHTETTSLLVAVFAAILGGMIGSLITLWTQA
jgi:hypothetical protein